MIKQPVNGSIYSLQQGLISPEMYSSISETFRITHAEVCLEAILVLVGVKQVGLQSFPGIISGVGLFERRINYCVAIPDPQSGGGTGYTTLYHGRGPSGCRICLVGSCVTVCP